MQSNYLEIFDNLFYSLEDDMQMRIAVKEVCDILGSIIVKYGELLNEFTYNETDNNKFTNMVLTLFLRKIMEHLDAINILVEKGSFSQAEIILRTLFESVISLKFILKEDTDKRTSAYYLYHHYEEIEKMKYFDAETREGRMLKDSMGDKKFAEYSEKCKCKKEAFERLIQSKQLFREIDEMRSAKIAEKRHQGKKPYIQWYEMCSNVTNVYGLVKSANWQKYYESLYGGMSMEAHGYNATTGVVSDKDAMYLKPLRYPKDGFHVAELAGTFCVSILKDLYTYLQDGPEELREFEKYFLEYQKRRDSVGQYFEK